MRAALVLAVLALSFAAPLFRLAEPTPPLVKAGIRLGVAALLLAPFVWRARVRGRLPAPVLRAALGAGLLYALHFGAWVWSLSLTSVAASVTLVTATPLLLAIVGLITGRDPPTRRLWISLALAAVGVTIIGGHDLGAAPSALTGDLLALLGAVGMAGYLVVVRRLGAVDPLAFTGVAAGVGAVVLLGGAAALGLDLRPPSAEATLALCLAALVPQLIGHTALTWALRRATPTQVGLATVGEPVGAAFLAWLWLGERVAPPVFFGAALTLTAVVLALRRERPPPPV